jgi:hypothetical protein
LAGTSNIATFAELPIRAQTEINKKYKEYSIGDVIFYDDNEANETDMIFNNMQLNDEDCYFVELKKGIEIINLEVNIKGDVSLIAKRKS